MPFGLPGVASVPLTQVFDRFISLFHPSTMSVVGSMNCSQVSVMVSLEIGLAKMFECEMCPRLCVHCTKTAPPNHETQTSKTKQLGVSRPRNTRTEPWATTQAREIVGSEVVRLLTLRTLPVVSIPPLPSGRVGNFLLLPGGRVAIILGSGLDDSSTGFKKLVEVVLFHSGFLFPTVLAGRARRVPSLSPGRKVTRVVRRAFVNPVSFDGKIFFVAGPEVIHAAIVAFGSAGAV